MTDKYVFQDSVPSVKSKMKLSTLLPEYIQTVTNRNFIDATYETLFSEDLSETVAGYVGEKPDTLYNNKTDFYLPEINKNRSDYQLTPLVSKNISGEFEFKKTYQDIINHLKYQGANINSHERLFRQEFYSFAPMIDINKFLNYSQYYWLDKGPSVVDFTDLVESVSLIDSTFTVTNHTYSTGDKVTLSGSYPPNLLPNTQYYVINVDSNEIQLAETLEDAEANVYINFQFGSNFNVTLQKYTDLSSYIGLVNGSIFGLTLSNGLVIRSFNDALSTNNGVRYIVEGVGSSIRLIELDVLIGYDSSPYDTQPYDYDERSFIGDIADVDYVTIERGSIDQNIWSMRNRWFHISVLGDIDLQNALRAQRPIIEFVRDIELYDFAKIGKGAIDLVYANGNIQSIMGNEENIIDGVVVANGMKILVINDADTSRSNIVYEVFGLDQGSFSLTELFTLENDEGVFVRSGDTYNNTHIFNSNGQTNIGQQRIDQSTDILFQLYDYEGNRLSDESIYPENNFTGSTLFQYKRLEDGTPDTYLGRIIAKNTLGDYLYVNTIDNTRYTYVSDFIETEIIGSYFCSIGGEFRNHWHKNDIRVNQAIIDEYVIEADQSGNFQRQFKLSQVPMDISDLQPINLIVKLDGRRLQIGSDFTMVNTNGENIIGLSDNIRLSDAAFATVSEGSLIKIYSYSDEVPSSNFSGHYEVPSLVGLTSNIDNKNISEIGRNEVFDHFASILERQTDFTGEALGNNNSNNLNVHYGRGNKIVQNTASLTKLAVINNNESDVILSVNYGEHSYRRFNSKFNNKIAEYHNKGYGFNVSYSTWVSDILNEINLGKSESFPYFNSGMAGYDFVPPSPAYLGLTPMFRPHMFLDTTLINPTYMIRCHTGELVPAKSVPTLIEEIDLDVNIDVYQINKNLVYPWEVVINLDGVTLVPFIDYIVVGNSNIQFKNHRIGDIEVFDIGDIEDCVKLYFENEVANSSPFHEDTYRPVFNHLEHKPGFFRSTDYSKSEYNDMLSDNFNRWVSFYGADPYTNVTTDVNNHLTWNYTGSVTKTGDILKGSWRSIFLHYYDTDRPALAPWEMLGFTEKPYWWVSTYGDAPYTSVNVELWNDIRDGVIRHGLRAGSYDYLKRPSIHDFIPVDGNGIQRSVVDIFGIQEPSNLMKRADWTFGDVSPIEYQWMRSFHYNFGQLVANYRMKPNNVVDLLWEPENKVRLFPEQEFSQLVTKDTYFRQKNSTLKIHNTVVDDERIFKFGLQQYIIGYVMDQGKSADFVKDIVNNISVNLSYRVGGFVEDSTLRVVADNFGLVPNENRHIVLHNSSALETINYSGVIVTKLADGYKVTGYNDNEYRFVKSVPVQMSKVENIRVGGKKPNVVAWTSFVKYAVGTYIRVGSQFYRSITEHRSSNTFENDLSNWVPVPELPNIGGLVVKKYSEYTTNENVEVVEYNKTLKNAQEIADLLLGYEHYLESLGFSFDTTDQTPGGTITTFEECLKQILTWIQTNPTDGDTLALSPFATKLKLTVDHGYVDTLENFPNGIVPIISGNGWKIDVDSLMVSRHDNNFVITIDAEKTTELLYGAKFVIKEIEHLIIFDNITNFNDVIMDDLVGIRQPRFKLYMTKSGDWSGRMKASGFIINETGLSSNLEKSVNDFRKFYDTDQYVIGGDFNAASKRLVGFQSRDYFDNVQFDARDSFQFYSGMLKEKGSSQSVNKFLRNDFVRSRSNISINEEWAIRLGSYGNTIGNSNIKFKLLLSDIKSNPQIVKFEDNGFDDPRNSEIEISANDDRFLFVRPSNPGANQFEVGYISPKLPNAGYALLSDAKVYLPFLNGDASQLFKNTNGDVSLVEGDRLWVADTGSNDWGMFKLINSSQTISVVSGTTSLTVTIDDTSDFSEGQYILFDKENINTIFEIKSIVDSTKLIIGPVGVYTISDVSEFVDATILTLENIRFVDTDAFEEYTPIKPWTSTDLIFIDNVDGKWNVINPVSNETRVQPLQSTLGSYLNGQLVENNIVLANIDPYHPNMGVIPFDIRKELDFITAYDPAKYNSLLSSVDKNIETWAKEQVGKIWWNLDAVRYIDYDQHNDVYKVNHWGGIFPGSSIDVYQWVRSPMSPSKWADYLLTTEGLTNYSPESTPLSDVNYTVTSEYNILQGRFVNYYYFWVKNNNFILANSSKNLSTYAIASAINNPTKANIKWMVPTGEDTLIISNTNSQLSDDTAIIINFGEKNGNVAHSEWYIFGALTDDRNPPDLVFDKIKHSLVGYVEITDTITNLKNSGLSQSMIDTYGEINGSLITVKLPVPDENIHSMTKYGNQFRPRQTWFADIQKARNAFVVSVNDILSRNNWVDSTNDWQSIMFTVQPEPSESEYDYKVSSLFERDLLVINQGFSSGKRVLVENDISLDGRWSVYVYDGSKFIFDYKQEFRLEDFWNYKDYYLDGYDSNTVINETYDNFVDRNNDIDNLVVGSIVKVNDDGYGNYNISEVIESNGIKSFRLISKQNATFVLNDIITDPYAISLLYDAYVNFLSTIQNRNEFVIDMCREALRQTSVLDFIFPTSIVDVIGLEEELTERPILVDDIDESVMGYISEIKPYHVKTRNNTQIKSVNGDVINVDWSDFVEHNVEILFDRVSCVADMTLEKSMWKAAERIQASGGNPSDIIPGCKFRGTEIDGQFFTFFDNIIGAGYDHTSYDASILGYDFGHADIQLMYDTVINGKNFGDTLADSDTIVNGGDFYQPLLSANRPPELAKFVGGDTISIDVLHSPYGYSSMPKIHHDTYIVGAPEFGDYVQTRYLINSIPQSNKSIFVYLNDVMLPPNYYNIYWTTFELAIELLDNPNVGDVVKITSFGVGGSSKIKEYKFIRSLYGNIVDMDNNILETDHIKVYINGFEQIFTTGGGLEPNQIELNVSNGTESIGSVLIVVYDGSESTNFENIYTIYSGQSIPVTNISDFTTDIIVYKDGRKLNPGLIRYFDPIDTTDSFYAMENIYDPSHMETTVNGLEITPSYNLIENTVNTDPYTNGDTIRIINDVIAEYSIVNDELNVHVVATAGNNVTSIEEGLSMEIDTIGISFTRPDGNTNPIPLDRGLSPYIVVGGSYGYEDVLGISETLEINGNEIIIENNDTIIDIISKIDTLTSITGVTAAMNNSGNIVLSSDGHSFNLTGNWSVIGITSGNYLNVVDQIQTTLGSDYRISGFGGRLKIIKRVGSEMNLVATGSENLLNTFGFGSLYTTINSLLSVTTIENNSQMGSRTEVYMGNASSKYPLTRNGLDGYSTLVSLNGLDRIVKHDFDIVTIDEGYDVYGYDQTLYDYSENPGVSFGNNIEHRESSVVMITSFDGNKYIDTSITKVFKNLRNEYEFYKIGNDHTVNLKYDFRPTDTYLVVADTVNLALPNVEDNIPAYIWIDGEVIGYYGIEKIGVQEYALTNLIRGAKGTAFGVVNHYIYDGDELVDKYIKAGTKIYNLSGSKIPEISW